MQEDSELKEIDWPALREMARELNMDDYDEPVHDFVTELLKPNTDTLLLKQGATMLLQDEIDFSPEMVAMGIDPDPELIDLFIAAGADLNARNPYGETPLCIAASYGYTEIIDLLLEAGADPKATNAKGKIAADVASTPELIKKLIPAELRNVLLGDDTEEGLEPLPDFIEDADCDEADDDYFAPRHDCGLGE